ncbi:MAG: hypothetical protein M3443_06725 [Actinomycetota bacterium]|nr:hypothetical protein [Actinomycetota bacterium]
MAALPKRNPARRNRSTTASTLSRVHDVAAPPLPARDDEDRPWHPLTEQWWAALWASPMAPEYDGSDVHGLLMLAVLVDTFWHRPNTELASEIRLQRQAYGLSPIDRRRLQWEIERADEAEDRGNQRRAKTTTKPPAPDTRHVLKLA